jgi:hypothetical protein
VNLRALVKQEEGIAMLIVISLIALVSVLGVTLLETVRGESTRSAHAVWREESFHAAEAGLDDYIAKIIDDHVYYSHYVHPGEATRSGAGAGCTNVAAGSAWPAACGLTWTYPNGKDTWRGNTGSVQLGNGYEYDLQITAPSPGSKSIRILATGRKVGSTSTTDERAIEAFIRPSSIADFQMIANDDIQYGSTATTEGKIYAGIDANNVKHGIGHQGTAKANVYAEGCVGTTVNMSNHTCSGSGPTLQNGALTYNQSTIRTVLKNPVNFGSFLTSLTDIKRAAEYAGVKLDGNYAAWRLTFQTDGTFTVKHCTAALNVAQVSPTCTNNTPSSMAVPSNGAVYSPQTVIVSGVVDGRLTVASDQDIVVAGDISYESLTDDVLGLNAKNNVYVADWATGNDLTWRAATLAQSGEWRSYTCSPTTKNKMTFIGSTATFGGGCMSLYATRDYQYDDNLFWLPPPWFPTIEDAYTIYLFRELQA